MLVFVLLGPLFLKTIKKFYHLAKEYYYRNLDPVCFSGTIISGLQMQSFTPFTVYKECNFYYLLSPFKIFSLSTHDIPIYCCVTYEFNHHKK